MIFRSILKQLFAKIIGFKHNKYHPLVWINGNPKIGRNVYIGGFSELNCNNSSMSIGDNSDIASFVSINCADSHMKTIGRQKNTQRKPIIIEENVFIGSHSVILGGTVIRKNSVIGAGTIISNLEIPEFSLVVGNPPIIKKGYYK